METFFGILIPFLGYNAGHGLCVLYEKIPW